MPRSKSNELCSSAAVVPHKVNLPSLPLCHKVNLPSCVARRPLCHRINLSRCEAPGAPKDGFLLNALKTLFRLSRVLLDL